MHFLRQFSINLRLWLLLGITLACVLLIQLYELSGARSELLQSRQQMTRQQIDTAFSLIEHHYQLHQKGMDEQQARESAKQAIAALRYGENDYFWINDSNAVMVMHPIKPALDGKDLTDLQDPNGLYLFREMSKSANANKEGGFVNYFWPKPGSENPVAKTSFVKRFAPWDWIVGTGIYLDDVDVAFNTLLVQAMIFMALVVGLVVCLMLTISISIKRPLRDVMAAMKDISEGEGDLTKRLPESGKDEITGISIAFNRFVTRIQDVVEQVQTTSTSVNDSNDSILGNSQRIAELTNHQLQQTDRAAQSSEAMNHSIDSVASKAKSAVLAAKDADKHARNGLQLMDNTREQMQILADEISNSQQVVESLHNETNSIGSVLDVIRGIAEQTNLLALNAAIEAARAGEQGRGFAVVADEVRTLASRTQESTEEINTMIARLQEQAAKAVNAMEQSMSNSATTVDMSRKAADSISQINEAATTISEMNLSITGAVQEQSQVAKEIDDNFGEVVTLAKGICDAVNESQEQAARLNQSSETLGKLVSRFQV